MPPVPPLATGSVPVTPVVSGIPVRLVPTPLVGVPSGPPAYTNVASELFAAALELFGEVHGSRDVRLLGVGVSGFDARAQKSLFDDEPVKRSGRIDTLREEVREKFGKKALIRGSDLDP